MERIMALNEKFDERIGKKARINDFSKIGGLSNHLKILRETIIVPLLHRNIYSHFNIKTPRGILFYGPPGTGKTLVAGALATELTKQGVGKVAFYQRKGADVLDKWVGESEKKLRHLFEIAKKSRPSIIFFDEIDGLAPIRTAKNDHVQCSIVTTLLALMDGLDSVPGLIVIGATNRIESVDPALRRPGRFDRELYFPLPSTEARKEILQVNISTWRHKPSASFITHLADITPGFCGSDLQALCAETLLCSMKRLFPKIQKSVLGTKIKIEADEVRIEEIDFLNARKNITPSAQKFGNKMRRLSSIVMPLLQNQLDVILTKLKMMWPHFNQQYHRYLTGNERYTGRIILTGSSLQGLNSHIVPAILQNYEHLPAFYLNISTLQCDRQADFLHNLPSILVIPRVDELWTFLEIYEQNYVASFLDDIHAGLPILIVVTCDGELPALLRKFFYNSTSLIFNIDNPNEQQVEEFFSPIFFQESNPSSLAAILLKLKVPERASKRCGRQASKNFLTEVYKLNSESGRVSKKHLAKSKVSKRASGRLTINEKKSFIDLIDQSDVDSRLEIVPIRKKQFPMILTDLLKRSINYFKSTTRVNRNKKKSLVDHQPFRDSNEMEKKEIYKLWQRTCHKTAVNMAVANLEVLYDTISACISIHKDNFQILIDSLQETLNEIETYRQEHLNQ